MTYQELKAQGLRNIVELLATAGVTDPEIQPDRVIFPWKGESLWVEIQVRLDRIEYVVKVPNKQRGKLHLGDAPPWKRTVSLQRVPALLVEAAAYWGAKHAVWAAVAH